MTTSTITISDTTPAFNAKDIYGFLPFQGVTISDVDASDVLTVTVKSSATTSGGAFTPESTVSSGAVEATYGVAKSGDQTVTVTGKASDIQSFLRSLVYKSNGVLNNTTQTQTFTVNGATSTNGAIVAGGASTVVSIAGTTPAITLTNTPTELTSVQGGLNTYLFVTTSLGYIGASTDTLTMTLTASDAKGGWNTALLAGNPDKGLPAVDVTTSLSSDGTALTVTGTATNLQAALKDIGYTAGYSLNGASTENITVQVSDPNSDSVSSSTKLDIVPPAPATLTLPVSTVSNTTDSGENMPFAGAVIGDTTGSVTLSIFTKAGIGTLDLSALNGTGASGLVGDVTYKVSDDGASAVLTGNAASVEAALNYIAVKPETIAAGTTATGDIAVSVVNVAGGVTQDIAYSVTAPADLYYQNIGTGVYAVDDAPGHTASLDLSAVTGATTVFGNTADVTVVSNATVLVMNGSGQYGTGTLIGASDTAANAAWVGSGSLKVSGAGSSVDVITGNGGSVTLNAAQGASAVVEVWGSTTTTASIDVQGSSSNVIFGGAAALTAKTQNSVIVGNGDSDTGSMSLHSSGNDQVWAGTADITLFTNGGTDQVFMTGSSAMTLVGFGDGTGTGAVTSFTDLGGHGSLVVDGGSNDVENVTLSGTSATVFGGNGVQNVTQNGSGSLVIADGATVSGSQTVNIGAGATGSFQFWGGSSDADITLGGNSAYIVAGSGNTTLTGGTGNTTLTLSDTSKLTLDVNGATSGNIDVYGYKPSTGTLNITDMVSTTQTSGGSVVLLQDGSSITFHGYNPNS